MLKHYGPHGNPLSGLNLASVECGLRDLHEIYLKPFEMVVKNTGILAVMSTYNSWNHIPNSASHYLLTDILRDEWGFKGYVYSDWGAIEMLKTLHFTARNSSEAAIQAISAGLVAEASSKCYPFLKGLIEKGQNDCRRIDRPAEKRKPVTAARCQKPEIDRHYRAQCRPSPIRRLHLEPQQQRRCHPATRYQEPGKQKHRHTLRQRLQSHIIGHIGNSRSGRSSQKQRSSRNFRR